MCAGQGQRDAPEARAGRLLCAQSRVGPRAGQEHSASVAALQEPAVSVTPQAQPPRWCKARPRLPSERQYERPSGSANS